MILKLENTTTHQIFEYDVIDKNYGEKLYFRFDINTLQLEDGEYSLTLYDGEDIVVTDLLKVGDFNPQTLQYKTGDNTYISIELGAKLGSKYAQITGLNTTIFPDDGYDGMTDVVIDATPIYNNTKDEWYTKGVNDQKKLLSSIEIDTNGVYTNENGYDEVVVNVPDLNGAYDDGYSDGKTDGYNQGYAEGEKVSYDNGYSDGKESVASNARVLDVTENGSYLSEFSDEVYIYPKQVTGDFGDGTYFYDWGEIEDGCFNTEIPFDNNTRIEFWWKAAKTSTGSMWQPIFGAGLKEDKTSFEIRYYNDERTRLQIRKAYTSINFNFDDTIWNHFVYENNMLYLNDTLITTFTNVITADDSPILINSAPYCYNTRLANGLFGMFKINEHIFIPKDGGFINYQTGKQLGGYATPSDGDIPFKGQYVYTENEVIHIVPEGPLYKTVNVNVHPKINIEETGLKFGGSTFKKVPEWTDWKGITNMYKMFYDCSSLTEIPLIDTSNVITMERMLYYCGSLQTFSLLDTSKVSNMSYMFASCGSLTEIPLIDTSNVTIMDNMFSSCGRLITIPQLDTSKVKNMSRMLEGCGSLLSVPPLDARSLERQSYGLFGYGTLNNLTDFGGLIGLKASMDGTYSFDKTPNLTYESCINILNGLYDFTGNGETPASNQGKLKVHSNFLTTVGDEISIGTNKGWTITA